MTPEHAHQHLVYLALGTNLGDRRANLASAVARLAPQVRVERISHLYETEPAYLQDQPRFLNIALRGATEIGADQLLAFLKELERRLGRTIGPRFGPRLIDIDILLYDDQTIATDVLTVPHPRMAERPFVLAPLAEIAPELVPPGWNQTVAELAQRVRNHGDVIAVVGTLEDV